MQLRRAILYLKDLDRPDEKYSIYPIAGGEPQPVAALTEADVVALWSADGNSVQARKLRE